MTAFTAMLLHAARHPILGLTRGSSLAFGVGNLALLHHPAAGLHGAGHRL
jgi:hypothetical protein